MAKMGAIGESIELIQEEAEKGLETAVQQVTSKGQGQQSGKPSFGKAQGKQTQAGQTQSSKAPQTQKSSDQTNPADDAQVDLKQTDETADKAKEGTKTFLKYLYGSTSEITKAEIEKKELEDKQKKEALRQRLHSEYYQRLTNPKQQQQTRSAEKVEMEKKEEEAKKLEEEEKKPKPLPVIVTKERGTKEGLRGVSG